MSTHLTAYRATELERQRVSSILRMTPLSGMRALDLGAREGFFSRILAERYEQVVAVDLQALQLDHPRITCLVADGANLPFEDKSFDFTLCVEVLEHISAPALQAVCRELVRVSNGPILIGVPFRQDLRLGRLTCGSCGRTNPPWGHVNSFDQRRLEELFTGYVVRQTELVAVSDGATNWVSARLMDFAGNPYGTYSQDEACVYCGKSVGTPAARNLLQRGATRIAHILNRLQTRLTPSKPLWIHILFDRRAD